MCSLGLLLSVSTAVSNHRELALLTNTTWAVARGLADPQAADILRINRGPHMVPRV